MRNLCLAPLILLPSLLLSGCAPSYNLTSKQFSPTSTPPHKILIVLVATDERLNHFPTYYQALEQRLQADISACGIQQDIITIPMPALLELTLGNPAKSAKQKIEDRIKAYQPDHLLQVNDSNEIGREITSNAQLSEIPSHKMIWQTGIKRGFWDMPLGFSDHGVAMADGIIEQLNSDGVLRNCPPNK